MPANFCRELFLSILSILKVILNTWTEIDKTNKCLDFADCISYVLCRALRVTEAEMSKRFCSAQILLFHIFIAVVVIKLTVGMC